MKKILIVFILLLQPVEVVFAQELVLWLQNDEGIVEDSRGSVIRWENQIARNGDAVQNNSALGGELEEETYPGRVNVGFNTDGSFLALEDSSTYFSDNSFSVFYTGAVDDVDRIANLVGNLRAENSNFSRWSGIRFARLANGDLAFQYAAPNFQQIILKNLPEDEFFFFGFTMNASGDYKYFDNTSDDTISGNINGAITPSNRDFNLNLHLTRTGTATFDLTEVAELMVYDDYMSDAEFQERRERLSSEFPEIVESDFAVSGFTPTDTTDLLVSDPISITFSGAINTPVTAFPRVFLNKTDIEVSGNWSVTAFNTLTFNSDVNWPYGALVKVIIDPRLESSFGTTVDLQNHADYNFLVETEESYGFEFQNIASIATVNNGTHNLPATLALPTQRNERIPVHFWVHGGGWSGGTIAASESASSPHGEYLAEHLGVATIGVSYRTLGSNGNFTQAMEDVDTAFQWAEDNADLYNFDMTRVFFSGGSAGSPLAALAAQRYSGSQAFVGFNGIYNFVDDGLSRFATGNNYGQRNPSAFANSAFHQLRDNPPAILVVHGTADTTINIRQSILFGQEVEDAGSLGRVVQYQGEPHAFFNRSREEYEDVLFEMVQFLNELGLSQNEIVSTTTPPTGFVEIRNEALNGWLESTTLPDPTNSAQNEVRLNSNGVAGTLWQFVESSEAGWYFIFTENGEYLQMLNSTDIQGSVSGLGLRASSTGGGTWTKWQLQESPTTGEYHLINQQFQHFLRATKNAQNANGTAYFVHGGPTSINGLWARWQLVE